MFRFISLALAVIILQLATSQAQAIDLNPLSAIKNAVEAAVEDRSSSDIAKDFELKTKITAKIVDKMGTDVFSLNTDVYEQDVMLTGAVENKRLKAMAASFAKSIKGVKKLYNEVIVIKGIDQDKGAAENFIDDAVIEGKINALLLDAKGVNVTNFRWRAVGGQVFLFGRAFSKAESSKATGVVKGIKNVVSVTSRVKIAPK
ncbi:MAG: BON domain-containing protein [Rhodospirillaceae bacterium]|jgi:hyperosmotically inducible periplasmic protein|nr:BON domain-containing protein [Rhodospirillaceae bacterium]MBT5243821.1 BON domain-containing protein [Rhodospirillaceae bacterium]MBT5563765.1 BON domain-containing protein [Rhodospirillaceae bacterium]MBT6242785.1 BON domain-containing protein [Rhodospirillaceae bacterium]MBT7137495.1 BON domain-containing protein [Rhodospirillaceae bacterium]